MRLRGVGGLSVQRLQTIRDLYQVLKAFRMRPEPDNLRKNIPVPGDESLANFGRRILNQLERMREQRIKQLASRVVEAVLGAGRMKKPRGRDQKRPEAIVDRPCHVVVVENLEHYKPEDSRLRRENRQLMNWAARNVRKYIMEGCQLYGLHFVEVSPTYTSRQDSRTGAPGVRCEDVSRKLLEEAARRADSTDGTSSDQPRTQLDREIGWWVRDIRAARKRREEQPDDAKARDRVLAAIADRIADIPSSLTTIRLPRRGGELFVSMAADSPAAGGLQADLNAAANIGLKALTDPDWEGAWWFVLVTPGTGDLIREKIQGSVAWDGITRIEVSATDAAPSVPNQSKKGRTSMKRKQTAVYAFNPLFAPAGLFNTWITTGDYWKAIENQVGERLRREQTEAESRF